MGSPNGPKQRQSDADAEGFYSASDDDGEDENSNLNERVNRSSESGGLVSCPGPPSIGNLDRGGQNVPNARGGGGLSRGGGKLAPKVAPRRLGLLTPKLAIFIFGDLTPPYPGLQLQPLLLCKKLGKPQKNQGFVSSRNP